jgi:hypothetical protein
MEINDFLKEKINELINIIHSFDDEFTSHDFLKKFTKSFEPEYISFLNKYSRKGAFQNVHSQIARFLSKNSLFLGIAKTRKVMSENVFGEMDEIQSWKRL